MRGRRLGQRGLHPGKHTEGRNHASDHPPKTKKGVLLPEPDRHQKRKGGQIYPNPPSADDPWKADKYTSAGGKSKSSAAKWRGGDKPHPQAPPIRRTRPILLKKGGDPRPRKEASACTGGRDKRSRTRQIAEPRSHMRCSTQNGPMPNRDCRSMGCSLAHRGQEKILEPCPANPLQTPARARSRGGPPLPSNPRKG